MLLTPRAQPCLRLLTRDGTGAELRAHRLPFGTSRLPLRLHGRALLGCHVADALAHHGAASDHAIVPATIIGADAGTGTSAHTGTQAGATSTQARATAGEAATLHDPFAQNGALAWLQPTLAKRLDLRALSHHAASVWLGVGCGRCNRGADKKPSESE